MCTGDAGKTEVLNLFLILVFLSARGNGDEIQFAIFYVTATRSYSNSSVLQKQTGKHLWLRGKESQIKAFALSTKVSGSCHNQPRRNVTYLPMIDNNLGSPC